MHTLAILNPHAASGRSLRQFNAIKPLLLELCDTLRVAVTPHPREIPTHLRQAADEGLDTLLALGGDGTNMAVLNALAEMANHPFTFAALPFGTGRDWARTIGTPTDPIAAFRWLAEARQGVVDVGRVTLDGRTLHFLNVASAGLSGEVGRRTNRAAVKRPWTFVQAILSTLATFDAPPMRVWLDGEPWYEGRTFLTAVGNGRFFGRGMKVCPDARIDDGLFDVMLVEDIGKARAVATLPALFSGTHVSRPFVRVEQARHVRLEALGPDIGIEMDGEPTNGRLIEVEVVPLALPVLLHPGTLYKS